MHRSFYKRPLFLLFCLYALFLFVFFKFRPPQPAVKIEGRGQVSVTGIVESFPRKNAGGYAFILRADSLDEKPFGNKVYVAVGPPQTGDGVGRDCAARSACSHAAGAAPLSYSEMLEKAPDFKSRVRLGALISEPSGRAGKFSWAAYLASQGIFQVLRATGVTVENAPPFYYRTVNSVRKYMLGVLHENFSAEESAVLGGITLGERVEIPDSLSKAFRDSGAMHLLVASGSNVGFVTFGVFFLCAFFLVRRQYAVIPAVLCAGFYTLCAGGEAPLARAFIMACAGAGGYLLGRESGILNGLLLAAFGILIADPLSILRADFAMSCLASGGIILGFAGLAPDMKMPRWLLYVCRIALMSLFAQLMLLPVLAAYFQRFSVSGLVSNLFLVPLAGVVMFAGFAVPFLALLPFKLPLFLAVSVTAGLTDLFLWLVRFFAGLPFAALWVPSPGWGVTALYYSLIMCLLHLRFIRQGWFPWKRIAAAGLIAFSVWTVLPAKDEFYISSARNREFSVFKSKSGFTVLQGSGCSGEDAAKGVLALGGRNVRVFLAPSLSEQDIGGLDRLRGIVGIENVILPYGPVGSRAAAILMELEGKGVPVKRLWPGEKLDLSDKSGRLVIESQMPEDGGFRAGSFYSGNPDLDSVSYLVSTESGSFSTGALQR